MAQVGSPNPSYCHPGAASYCCHRGSPRRACRRTWMVWIYTPPNATHKDRALNQAGPSSIHLGVGGEVTLISCRLAESRRDL